IRYKETLQHPDPGVFFVLRIHSRDSRNAFFVPERKFNMLSGSVDERKGFLDRGWQHALLWNICSTCKTHLKARPSSGRALPPGFKVRLICKGCKSVCYCSQECAVAD